MSENPVDAMGEIAQACGGKATLHTFSDESGNVVHAFGTMSLPLPENHWIHKQPGVTFNAPPMPFRVGSKELIEIKIGDRNGFILSREQFAQAIRVAGRYAVKSATMDGEDNDFDPNALVLNLVVGFLGYWTENGLSDDEWMNPKEEWRPGPTESSFPSSNVEATGTNPPCETDDDIPW